MPLHDNDAGTLFANLLFDSGLSGLGTGVWEFTAWIDDPREDGAQEADFPGYTPAAASGSDWEAAEGREASTTDPVSLGTPSDEGSDAIRFWGLRHISLNLVGYSAHLARDGVPASVFISASSEPVEIDPTVRFN